MSDPQGSFVWYELMSTDVAAAKAFYATVVGWEAQDVAVPGMTYTIWRMGAAQVGGAMGLNGQMCDSGLKPCWVGYIHVQDVDAAAKQVTRLGGKVHRPPTDIPNVGRFAVVADPLGAVFHLFKPNQSGERPASTEPGQIGWHELHTTDWPRAFDFYNAMFGWSKGDAIDMGDMGVYQLVTRGGAPMGGLFNSCNAQNATFWLYYFTVTDIEAAAKKVAANGGHVTQGPMAVPDGSWVIQAKDPQGAAFALVGPKL